jgi:hypothetical protein
MIFLKFMVHQFLEIHGPWFFEIQCPKDFCDFAVFNRLAQAGGGALLYDILLLKSQRPKLLPTGVPAPARQIWIQKTQNFMLISIPLKKLRKTHGKLAFFANFKVKRSIL